MKNTSNAIECTNLLLLSFALCHIHVAPIRVFV